MSVLFTVITSININMAFLETVEKARANGEHLVTFKLPEETSDVIHFVELVLATIKPKERFMITLPRSFSQGDGKFAIDAIDYLNYTFTAISDDDDELHQMLPLNVFFAVRAISEENTYIDLVHM